MDSKKPSVQDFSTVNSHVTEYSKDYNQSNLSNAFYYFVLDLVLGLQEDEIIDAITDTNYLQSNSSNSGHDRGVDAVYIDETGTKPVIHIFNCKYTENSKKTVNNFPSGEIDKIIGFLDAVMQEDENLHKTINPILYSKVEEIWELHKRGNPEFVVHLCANYYLPMEKMENERFERSIQKYRDFKLQYHLMDGFIRLLTTKDKQIANASFRAIGKNFYEKSGGDIRALIVNIEARDLIRIVVDNERLRNSPDLEDFEILKEEKVLEDAFEDNVRIYLKQRTNVNKNIMETALSNDSHRFFYFNNGITITCSRFKFVDCSSPVIELENLQVVNGSQTIHALYEAFKQGSDKFDSIDLLCRIYETQNQDLSTKIAEYTNSQNPVKSRDIRSIDIIQKKLESEFNTMGYFYERKKNQHSGKPRGKRIDAEKVGQVLFAFYNQLPHEAKNSKRLIFADKYEEIFNDTINANKVLLAYELFNRIEKVKNEARKNYLMNADKAEYNEASFILYASYHILYLMGEMAAQKNIELTYANVDLIWSFYEQAEFIVKDLIKKEQESNTKLKYAHPYFFKSNRPKDLYLKYHATPMTGL
jgi:hypothetical protein